MFNQNLIISLSVGVLIWLLTLLILYRIGKKKMVEKPFNKALIFVGTILIIYILSDIINYLFKVPLEFKPLFWILGLLLWFGLLKKIYQFSWGQTIKTGIYIGTIGGVVVLVAGYFVIDRYFPEYLNKINVKIPQQEKGLYSNKEKNSETANWKLYQNSKYGYEIQYPNDAILIVPKEIVRTAYEGALDEFPVNAYSITIKVGNAFVSVCDECGSLGGVGIGTEITRQQVIIDDKNYDQTTIIANEGRHKIASINLPGLEIRYGYMFDDGEQLVSSKIPKSVEDVDKILSTFKFIK